MKALCWYGRNDVRVETVAEPRIVNPRDALVKTTLSAICGSDLHLLHGYIPMMKQGDILGHEFMGEVVEVGSEVTGLKKGDRVVAPFNIACGRCWFCQQGLTSLCDNSNPNAQTAEELYGYSPSGLFGYSHIFGGYAGGQAEYVRVPFSDTACVQVPESVSDEQALFLSDIFPTGFMAAENCNIHAGDTIAIWGCGPVGQFAIKSAYLLGAERVIAIDEIPERLELAHREGKADILNFGEGDVVDRLKEMTGGRGPDGCIDAVGMEAHGTAANELYDQAKMAMRLESDRPYVLRQAIQACRKAGNLSVPGVYGGAIDKFPMGVAFSKGLTLRMGQTNVHRYMKPLLDRIVNNEIDPSFVITDRYGLECAPEAYKTFDKHEHGCIKVVLRP